MRRHRLEMKKLIRDLMIVVMLGVVSAGAFAQKNRDEDKRPPKEPVKVITNDRKEKPPPNNNRPKQDPKKKP